MTFIQYILWRTIAGLVLLFVVSAAYAQQEEPQIELIVRPADRATELIQALESPRAKREAGSLFEGTSAVQPVFREPLSKSSDPSIPAYTLVVSDSTTLDTLLVRWRARDDVRYAQSNGTFSVRHGARAKAERIQIPLDRSLDDSDNVLADSLDHLDVVQARAAQQIVDGEEAVRVGILDTGLYLDHPDLANQFWINPAEDVNDNGRFDPADLDSTDADGNGFVDDVIGYDFVDRPGFPLAGEFETRDPDPSPDLSGGFSGHGTQVAGIAAAMPSDRSVGIKGVAPGAQIVPLRAFGGDGRGQTDDIAAAIVYAANLGVDVVNMSFGRSRQAPLLEEAIQYAFERGTVLVASAGNQSTDDPHYPSDYPEVISVMWLAEDGTGIPQFSRSQFGIGVDLGAPGSNVFTSRLPRSKLLEAEDENPPSFELEDLYGNASGSSFSAPQVAGAAALLRAVDADLTPASIRDVLLQTSLDIDAPGWDHVTGAGRLDVLSAVTNALPARTEIVSPAHNAGTTAEHPLPIVATSLHPRFVSFSVSYARGTRNLDERSSPWNSIAEPSTVQVRNDTVATWDVTGLAEGEYTLRLVTTLTDGSTIEDRRRLIVDRSPPLLTVRFLGSGLLGGDWGVVADVETDDDTRAHMDIQLGERRAHVESEFRAQRHGLTWPDERGTGGTAAVTVRATNASGLTAQLDTTLSVSPNRMNTAFFRRTETQVPAGRLLPQAPDFDGDGLREIILNQRKRGGISDTLRGFEWGSSGFLPTDTLIANVIPRDVGDTDGDGLQELLTQVAANTLLLEQGSPMSVFPTQEAFIDSTGLRNPDSTNALIGTLLSDLDGDGNGEIVGNNQTQWRVLEWNGSDYGEILRLDNPTSLETIDTLQNGNKFGTAAALDGDFDDDGRGDLLVGDRDGDWVVYESTGDNSMRVAWTFATDQVDAGDRFAAGDWDGDGVEEFITFNTFFRLPLDDGDFEPPLSFYHVWDGVGDDAYERAFRLPVVGETAGGSIATADFDGDNQDEIALSHPPALYVLDYSSSNGWTVVYHDADAPTILSRSMTAADFDGNGFPELLAATTDQTLARYEVQEMALASPPPRWVDARPTGTSSFRLEWRAPRADSVSVFAAGSGQSFDPIATVSDSMFLGTNVSVQRRYALRAWRSGDASPLSEARVVRPHAPAQVAEVTFPAETTVRLQFTEPLARTTKAEQFVLEGAPPTKLLRADEGRAVLLRFGGSLTAGQLSWRNVRDEDGLPVGQTAVEIDPPMSQPQTLFVEEATILSERRVRLVFSDALDPTSARDASKYSLSPRGEVESVDFRPENPKTVELTITGMVVGATGFQSLLTVTEMQSAEGARLASEGRAVALNRPAEGLSNVFVYPNPYRAQQHGRTVTIAGLPTEATLRIVTPGGRLVRTLNVENNGSGGVEWNLRDRRGDLVPSGIYLIRVEAPDAEPVMEKAAVIR